MSTAKQLGKLDAQKGDRLTEGQEFKDRILVVLNRSYDAFGVEVLDKYNKRRQKLLENNAALGDIESDVKNISESIQMDKAKPTNELERFSH